MWITSFFDYGHNGVINDDKLQVGGWGDTYCTYLKFAHNPPACASEQPTSPPRCTTLFNPLEGLPQNVTSAHLELFAFNRGDSSTTTQMTLGLPTVDWAETCATTSQNTCAKQTKTGNGHTDFLSFQPPGQVYRLILLQPPPTGTWYDIDVTSAYSDWSNINVLPNHLLNTGIALCPNPYVSGTNKFNVFRSSGYVDVANPVASKMLRPKLIITYNDPTPTNIKMPLPAILAPPNEAKWLVRTEIGGRDCGWKPTGIEVDLAHTDANNSTGTNGTYFSIDFPKKVIINGTPGDWSGKTVPALAPFGGNVTKAGENDKAGKYVNILKDSGDFEVHLLHLGKQLVAQGAHVSQGQPVGIVGNTGLSMGPHLHMTIVYKGKVVRTSNH